MKISLFIIFLLPFLLTKQTFAQDKIVFCDVGQGDGAYIQLQNNVDIVIDAGPDNKILNCLRKHMRWFDNTIELMIVSHADSDHFQGFESVVKEYTVQSALLPEINNTDEKYISLLQSLEKKETSTFTATKGDIFNIGEAEIEVIFPSQKNISSCLPDKRNDCSYVFYFDIRDFTILFTGDIVPNTLKEVLPNKTKTIEVFKVPHHGSKNGLTQSFFSQINPLVNVVSLSKNNSYGHPHKEVLDILKEEFIMRTDTDGNIIIPIPN